MESDGNKSNENSIDKITVKESSDVDVSLNQELKIVVDNMQSGITKSNDNPTEKNNTNADTPVEFNTDGKSRENDSMDNLDKLKLLSSDGEDGDGVPGDFFDDFLKEDFMAGLDVVDDDDWADRKKSEDLSDSESRTVPQEKQGNEKKEIVEKAANKEKKLKKTKQKEEKSKRRQIKNDIGSQRDPKKTRRDIELDKAKCEKDKEMKRISEKLKLVETGLVPPGMEMETDIEVIEKQKDFETNSISASPKKNSLNKNSPSHMSKRSRSPRVISKNAMHRSRSPIRSRIRRVSPKKSRDRHLSPLMSRDRHQSPSKLPDLRDSLLKSRSRRESPPRPRGRRQSPRKSRDRRQSPVRSLDRRQSPVRSLDRRQSPVRSLDRRQSPLDRYESPIRSLDRRDSPLRRDKRESPNRSRRLVLSPLRTRARLDSPIRRSRVSPLRRMSRNRNSRSRSRSRDRRRRRSRSRTFKRREEKMSFLQEIAEKLRNAGSFQSHTPSAEMYHIGPQAASSIPIPTPVPAPPLSTQYPLQPQRYDQNFFIGTPQTNISQLQPVHYPVGLHNQMQSQIPIQQPAVQQHQYMQLNFSQTHVDNNLGLQTQIEPQSEFKAKDDMHKLYEDKKITLADFLAITAKPEVYSASPEQMKEKIKVISRCQDAIKYLGNTEKNFTGPLILHRIDNDAPSLLQDKFKSPLLKSSQVKFPFTEIPNAAEQKSKLFYRINNLLENLGLANDVILIDDEPDVNDKPANAPPTAPVISPPKNNKTNEIWQPAIHSENRLSKFSQTDAPRCLACEKRSKIVTKSTSVQCGDDSMKFSVGTQVREEVFFSTALPKNQSLASLTPAQLLAGSGSSRNNEVDDYNSMFPVMKNRPGFPHRMNPPQQPPPPPRGFFDSPSMIAKNKYNNYY